MISTLVEARQKFEFLSTCVYKVVRNVRSSDNLTCFVFLKHPFSRFALLPYYRRKQWLMIDYLVHPQEFANHCCLFLDCEISEVEKGYRIWQNSKWVRFYSWIYKFIFTQEVLLNPHIRSFYERSSYKIM